MIPNKKNIRTITDMRKDALKLLADVKKDGMKYIFANNEPQAIVMSMDEYEFWIERLEDMEDMMLVKKLEREKREGFTKLEDLAKEYGVQL